MPPKKKEIRKEEDEVDLATLPPWTAFTFYLACHPLLQRFFTQIQTKLAATTKPILRVDLVNLAKERQFWVPANAQEPPPIDALAKAFKLKILLLDILGRKAKKDLLTKIEDLEKRKSEAAEKNLPPPTDVIEEPDPSLPDVLYLAYEFPNTPDEIKAVAAEGAFVDMLLYLKPDDPELAAINEKSDREYGEKVTAAKAAGQEIPPAPAAVSPWTADSAAFVATSRSSERNSVARDLLVKAVTYSTPPAKLPPAEGDEPETDPYNADAEFLESALDTVSDTARQFIEYINWKKTTEVVPLFPHPKELEPVVDVVEGQGDAGDGEAQVPVVAQPVVVDLRSRDDEDRIWDFRLYKKLFSSVPEGVADERCFIGCMLQQLLNIGGGGSQIEQNEVTQMHEFFVDYWQRIRDHQLDLECSATNAGGRRVTDPRVLDEADAVEKRTKGLCFPNTSTEISQMEHVITEELVVPGVRRFQMPATPLKSDSLREAERPVIYPFSSFPFEELERNLVLTEFVNFLTDKEPGSTWTFTDRRYTEILSQNMLTIAISESMRHDPDVYSHYYARDDSLLVAVLFKPRPRRHFKRQWKSDWRIRPRQKDFDSSLKEKSSMRFLDIDEGLAGRLWEQVTYYYPADSSLIKMTKYAAGPQGEVAATSTVVLKDDMTLSLRGGNLQILFSDEIRMLCESSATGSSFTVLMPSGLTVKMLEDGSVLQAVSRIGASDQDDSEEENRIVTGMGTVISCLKNGYRKILYANGNVATKGPDGVWVRTNNKGLRRGLRIADGFECELDSIPCASVTDSKTFTKTITREDMVIIIRYSDNSQVTQHRDGTKMFLSPDGNSVLVEKEGYAPVRVRKGGKTDNVLSYAGASLGAKDLMERSADGRVLEVFLPDGSLMGSFKQALQTSEYGEAVLSRIHLLQLHTGATLSLQKDGEVVVISSLQSSKLTRPQIFTELFGPEDSRSSGVYTVSLRTQSLRLIDSEGNRYTVLGSGKVEATLAEPAEDDLELPQPVDFDGKQAVGCPRTEYPARLFVVYNTGAGVELLTESQIAQFKLTKEHESAIYMKLPADVCTKHVWLTPIAVTRLQQGHLPDSPLLRFDVPDVVHNIHHVHYPEDLPQPQAGLFRCILEYPEMTLERRRVYRQDLEKFGVWKAGREAVTKELGVMDSRNESQKVEDFKIQLQVLKLRKDKVGSQVKSAEECKSEMMEKLTNLPAFETVFKPPPPAAIQSDRESDTDLPGKKSIKGGLKKDEESGESSRPLTHALIQKPSFSAVNNKSFFNYFDSPEGHIYLLENRPKTKEEKANGVPPLEEVDADSLKNEDEKKSYEAMRDTLSQKMSTSTQQLPQEPRDDPLVVLQPEEVPKSKQKYPAQPIILKPVTGPSCFAETEMLIKQREDMKTMEADEYRDRKTKKYDVFGLPRATKPTVKSLRTSSPVKELNEKHVVIESATERRVKISSMAARIHMQAPSVQSMRREGVHTTIGRAIAKKMTVEEVENQQNAMINSKLQDPLTRCLSIIPENLRFGAVKEGGVFTMDLKVQNMGEQLSRFRIRQPEHELVRVIYHPSPIAPGVAQILKVQISADRVENIETLFHVVDNTFIYVIKVFARVVSERNFEELERENQRTKGKSVLSPAVKQVGAAQSVIQEKEWGETSSSDQNFPTLPVAEKQVIDPGKTLEQLKREPKS